MTRETDTNRETMADVSHTNPNTGETAGHLFTRGPVVAADGGRPDAETEEDERTMASVDHTPPHDAENANRVFERGKRPAGGDE
ncbi:hypothetical protein AB7C87_18820 [Natrarchaeobius sp. A-rgal3]|uniref:hypothetical protein n=1 Tax=Natrarchaeobius versutus TaxID=1679078 RepID=UPI003510A400